MTPEKIALVQGSWEAVLPIQDAAAELFYKRLFELDPAVRSLFSGDMTEQGRRLMSMIDVAVKALDRLDSVVPAIEDMGRRHARYGVKDADYDTVGAALLYTLATGLGDAFTPQVESAWIEVYGRLAGIMKAAAAQTAHV